MKSTPMVPRQEKFEQTIMNTHRGKGHTHCQGQAGLSIPAMFQSHTLWAPHVSMSAQSSLRDVGFAIWKVELRSNTVSIHILDRHHAI